FDSTRSGGDQRAEPQLPGPQRSRLNVPGESAHGRRQRSRGLHRGVRAHGTTRRRGRREVAKSWRSTVIVIEATAEVHRSPEARFFGNIDHSLRFRIADIGNVQGETVLWPM